MPHDQDMLDLYAQYLFIEPSDTPDSFITLTVDDCDNPMVCVSLSREETAELVKLLQARLDGPQVEEPGIPAFAVKQFEKFAQICSKGSGVPTKFEKTDEGYTMKQG